MNGYSGRRFGGGGREIMLHPPNAPAKSDPMNTKRGPPIQTKGGNVTIIHFQRWREAPFCVAVSLRV